MLTPFNVLNCKKKKMHKTLKLKRNGCLYFVKKYDKQQIIVLCPTVKRRCEDLSRLVETEVQNRWRK